MKIALIIVAPVFILGLLALAIPLIFVCTPYLLYDRRCKMLEKLELGEPKKEATNFLKSGMSLVNEWANQKTKTK